MDYLGPHFPIWENSLCKEIELILGEIAGCYHFFLRETTRTFLQGSREAGKPGNAKELSLKSGKTCKHQGIFLFLECFPALILFAPSFLVHMQTYFLCPSNTARRFVKKLENF